MKKKWIYLALGSILIAGGSAGTAIGIILPKALKAKKSLENFVSSSSGEDPYKYFGNKKLYYVSIGDSISAGANLTLKRNSYSFADFLANNLKNCNKLAGYKNFSITGQRISGLISDIFGNTSKMHVIKKADIISISIGANDLLIVAKLLEIGNVFTFDSKKLDLNKELEDRLKEFLDNKSDNLDRKNVDINSEIYDKKEVNGKKYKVGDTVSPLNQGEKHHLIRKSIHNFIEMYKKKDFHNIITLQPLWKDKIFDLIKRNIMTLIRDVHALNPKAKILFVAPFFPFPQLPEKDMNKKHEDIGMSLVEAFNRLISSIKEAAEFSIDGKNNFVDFIDISKLKISKSVLDKTDSRDKKNKYFKDYIKKQTKYNDVKKEKDIIPNYWKRNAFPNSFDIHPSIFGHQLIGNAIFSKIYKYLNIKNKKSEDFYTYTKPYNNSLMKNQELWTRLDEAPGSFNIYVQYFLTNLYHGKGNLLYSGVEIFKFFFTKNEFKDALNKLNKYLVELKKLRYEDYILILEILDDDKMIDIIVALFDNIKEIQASAKIAGDIKINSNLREAELNKILPMINVLTKSENTALWFKLQENLLKFEKKTGNTMSKNLFKYIFEFLIKPGLTSASNLVYLIED